ncbi:unnamed protein product, partial [Amoebophrya sp. A120]
NADASPETKVAQGTCAVVRPPRESVHLQLKALPEIEEDQSGRTPTSARQHAGLFSSLHEQTLPLFGPPATGSSTARQVSPRTSANVAAEAHNNGGPPSSPEDMPTFGSMFLPGSNGVQVPRSSAAEHNLHNVFSNESAGSHVLQAASSPLEVPHYPASSPLYPNFMDFQS